MTEQEQVSGESIEQVSEKIGAAVEALKKAEETQMSISQMTQNVGQQLDPAFPIVLQMHGKPGIGVVGGLSKREYYAAMAMQGQLANTDGINRVWKAAKESNPNDLEGAATDCCEKHLAERAVGLADALIKALSVSLSKGLEAAQPEQVPVAAEAAASHLPDAVEP